jgi:hypothetical protein
VRAVLSIPSGRCILLVSAAVLDALRHEVAWSDATALRCF